MENMSRTEGYGRECHSDAPKEHHEAFENVIAYAVAGREGKVVASMREHWCRILIVRAGPPGAMCVKEAIALCEEVCYGSLTKEIASMILRERCNNYAAGELNQALILLGGNGAW
jgi:hypothetical protein